MAFDLPVLATPYPAMYPIYDLSGFLAEGIVTTSAGGAFSVWGQITPNLVMVSLRVNPSGIINEASGNILEGLPNEFKPVVNTPDSALQGIFLMTDGRVWKRPYSQTGWYLAERTEVSCMFTAPRRSI
ncbi:hypothetical protein [Glutamicibacter halophytocola]|uniref:Uncharacterized protein n=1 Tax=Glutamicibacter halophytocola TaxID=1933880 RepID=A0AA94XUP4_9MICC|nr:hypothetical protein [Glutamicibacter halophytocola]UUX60183.1 hypothetical protein NUH22_06105 [Glutamicibacter halophytocola]